MAVAVSSKQQVTDLMQNMKLGDPPTSIDSLKKDATAFEAKSGGLPARDAAPAKENKGKIDTVVEQGFYYSPNNYYGFYFPGHETSGKWDEHGHFQVQYPGIHAENGSFVYYAPGYAYPQPTYNPYNAYIPGALIGADGQFLGHQHYYTGPAYQHMFSSGFFPPPVPLGSRESGSLVANRANAANGSVTATKPAEQAVLKETTHSNVLLSQNCRPMSQIQVNQQQGSGVRGAVLAKDYIPLRKLGPGLNPGKVAMDFTNNSMDFKPSVLGWVDSDRVKGGWKFNRNPNNENWNLDVLNEQNRGPRTNRMMRSHQIAPVGLGNAGSDGVMEHSEVSGPTTNRDQYNRAEFSTEYDDAMFFVIKSYSEDDVHKSIKYNVWASTANGNKRLDRAYRDAQERSGGKPGSCPVFLFFSVNASGQFCGVAEMIGSVDFEKSMDFWQQDKWSGVFPVKWHIIKDVPNSQFRQIILENNDNKPVTNSRDTQEIKHEQGIEMLNIFKSYSFKMSILDDFMFYEGRQKAMQDKKLRQHVQQRVQPEAQAGTYIQKKELEEQLYKVGEDNQVAKCSDLKGSELSSPMASEIGSQLSDLRDMKNNFPERKEESVQSERGGSDGMDSEGIDMEFPTTEK